MSERMKDIRAERKAKGKPGRCTGFNSQLEKAVKRWQDRRWQTPENIAIIKRYAGKVTQVEIAAVIGISSSNLRTWAKKNGIQIAMFGTRTNH